MIVSSEYLSKRLCDLNIAGPLWVGFSGGMDSSVLLDLTKRIYPEVKAVHVNHQLSTKALSWVEHCQRVCDQFNIPLLVLSAEIINTINQGPEAMAREARYRILAEHLPKNANLLLAHHGDDQAETVLLRLFRGAGPKGLGAMAPICVMNGLTLIRPLLDLEQRAMLHYAKTNQLTWIEDDSNENLSIDRNYLRKKIMPLIEKQWQGAKQTIRRTAKICQQSDGFVTQLADNQLAAVSGSVEGTLSITQLISLPDYLQQQVLRQWCLKQANIICEFDKIKQIFCQVIRAKQDKNPQLKIGHGLIRRYRDDLYCLVDQGCNVNTQDQVLECRWDGQSSSLQLANRLFLIEQLTGQGVSTKKIIKNQLMIKISQGRRLKKIFQDKAIPPWQRGKYPAIYYQDKLIAVVNLWIHPMFKAAPDETGIVFSFS